MLEVATKANVTEGQLNQSVVLPSFESSRLLIYKSVVTHC